MEFSWWKCHGYNVASVIFMTMFGIYLCMVDFAVVGSFYILLMDHIYLDLVTRMVGHWCSCMVHSSFRPIWLFGASTSDK